MPRILKSLIATACVALVLSASALATRIMVVSNIHYMDRALYQGSELFIRALRAGDGKYAQFGDELMAALCDQVRALRPDALIVTGDLTFNGERDSHAALAGWFARIEAQGTPVWVIPGNHDINVTSARGFAGDGWYAVPPVAPEEFCAIYADHMLPPEGGAGLSYAVDVNSSLRVAMTDVAYYEGGAQTFGLFTAGHAAWLEEALSGAGGTELITATHHSLLPHTRFSQESFLMFGHEAMEALALKHGVRLNLSGHMHAQHIARQGALADAALGAFCSWPHRYALVTLDRGALTYQAKSLDPVFLPEGFLEDSRAWFEGIAREKTEAALEGVDEDDQALMAGFAARFNLAYFAGTYDRDDPAWRDDPAYRLWRARADEPFGQYLNLVMDEPTGDNLCCAFNPD